MPSANAKHQLTASLPLQVMVYYNAIVSVVYFLFTGVGVYIKVNNSYVNIEAFEVSWKKKRFVFVSFFKTTADNQCSAFSLTLFFLSLLSSLFSLLSTLFLFLSFFASVLFASICFLYLVTV